MALLDSFTFDDIKYLTEVNPYLRGYLHGYLAELVLLRTIQTLPGVDSVKKIPDVDSRKGDLEIEYMGVNIVIECKSIGTGSVRVDPAHGDWSGTVSMKNSDKRVMVIDGVERTLVNVDKGKFDILAVNCFAVDGVWDFVFIENRFLLEKKNTPGYITSEVHINPSSTPGLTDNLPKILHAVFMRKLAACELK